MAYLVLARKYRSTTFDEVVAQEPVAKTLKNAIATGRVAHAYLFTGTRGVGKTTVARILAKALNCLSSDQPTPEPCNKCDVCESVSRGEDVDVVEIDGASNRGIDEIRELRANAIFRPSRCRFKIYYIDEVHMLTKEAFNALLKTLEEPPSHVKFIFATTEVEKVPATILSRCQRFDFRDIPTSRIAQHLRELCTRENVQADDDALYRVARAAAGSMRDALSLLDQLLAGADRVSDEEVVRVLGTPSDERTLAIARAVAGGSSASALGELAGILQGGVTLQSAVTALTETFRNMMVAGTCGGQSELIELPETQRQAVAELAKSFSVPSLVQAVAVLQGVSRSIRGSSVARALVEAALVRLSESEKFVDPSSLLDRLEALRGGAAGGFHEKKNVAPDRAAPTGRFGSAGTYAPARPAPAKAAMPGPGGPPARQAASPPPAAGATGGNGGPAASASPAVRPRRALSTVEQNEINKDPVVQTVRDLFGAAVEGMERDAPAAGPEEDE
ncbi:MAG: DNA polymerase III subunit tau [Planctomycetes bacterium ADurb.Bin126]|nr:MAG: DNA polymerase III subunit tau [Planctomycetes bacterium ADurb.Bin126]HOD82013.1 DNA polymerase III subunit gamma/tau [Phycisphaerae bacterium]HQL74863.1 DNA polymerase III subunit gamma/tau [Phycisphaerae bacterium]